jgi:hypothetical protein
MEQLSFGSKSKNCRRLRQMPWMASQRVNIRKGRLPERVLEGLDRKQGAAGEADLGKRAAAMDFMEQMAQNNDMRLGFLKRWTVIDSLKRSPEFV